MKRIPPEWKDTTNESYMFGDFDKDGVKNIDDFKPFDAKRKFAPSRGSYYSRSRFVTGSDESTLSSALRAVEKRANKSRPMMNDFLKGNPKATGRIKTVPSIIMKMDKVYGDKVGDLAGVKFVEEDYRGVKRRVKNIKKRYKSLNKNDEDDYYAKPKGGYYYAYHLGQIRGKKRMEIQIKTKRQDRLHAKAHKHYKKGKLSKKKTTRFTRQAKANNIADGYKKRRTKKKRTARARTKQIRRRRKTFVANGKVVSFLARR